MKVISAGHLYQKLQVSLTGFKSDGTEITNQEDILKIKKLMLRDRLRGVPANGVKISLCQEAVDVFQEIFLAESELSSASDEDAKKAAQARLDAANKAVVKDDIWVEEEFETKDRKGSKITVFSERIRFWVSPERGSSWSQLIPIKSLLNIPFEADGFSREQISDFWEKSGTYSREKSSRDYALRRILSGDSFRIYIIEAASYPEGKLPRVVVCLEEA